ncbi:MAG: oxidoreductase [Phototrophicales bacterium]|nr:MAG: oxidoreductase [Phototrophicales bacterium]
MSEQFRAYVIRQENGAPIGRFETLSPDDLPDGNVEIAVQYSSLNYKDGMAVTGTGKIIRTYPMVPGIDLVGTVLEGSAEFEPNQPVIVTGWGLGETHWGGYAQRARVNAHWIVPLPPNMTPQQAMAIGTAGFTAMLAVMAIERNGTTPSSGNVLVTGASGGVGSLAIAILSSLGYRVVASTGRPQLAEYLEALGAAEIIGRYSGPPSRPMSTQRWAAAIDNVGGDTLANIIAETGHMGNIASIGLTGSPNLNTTVYPFILRGVNLLGIDSTMAPPSLRREAWQRLANQLPNDKLEMISQVQPLSEIEALAQQIIAGQVQGRVVIDVNA